MPRKAVTDAVEEHLASNWSECPIIGANLSGEAPGDGTPFLVVQYPVSNSERLPISTPLYREEGAIRIVVSTERGSGKEKGLEWCDQLAALFRDQKIGPVNCQVPQSGTISDDADEGNYWVQTVVIPYWTIYTG